MKNIDKEGIFLKYNEERARLTKKRLLELRKEKNMSFAELSKALAEREVYISHTNLKNYEILDPEHALYGRTNSMSIEYVVAFADFYDVSVDYLLGNSNSRKTEYENVAIQLGLSDDAIEKLIYYKQLSEEKGNTKLQMERDTALINDFITSSSFDYILSKVKYSLLAEYMYKLAQNEHQAFLREHDEGDITKAKELLAKYGYFTLENDVVANVEMDNAIREVENYLRTLKEV